MKLQEAMHYYPKHETIVGHFEFEGLFDATAVEASKRYEWFGEYEGEFNFVRWNGVQFECWCFAFQRIEGYLCVDSTENFIPMTYSEDYGWEELIDDDDTHTFVPNSDEPVTVEDVVLDFDEEACKEGCLFTSYEELAAFVKNMEK